MILAKSMYYGTGAKLRVGSKPAWDPNDEPYVLNSARRCLSSCKIGGLDAPAGVRQWWCCLPNDHSGWYIGWGNMKVNDPGDRNIFHWALDANDVGITGLPSR